MAYEPLNDAWRRDAFGLVPAEQVSVQLSEDVGLDVLEHSVIDYCCYFGRLEARAKVRNERFLMEATLHETVRFLAWSMRYVA